MMYLQTSNWKIDLSKYDVQFLEENNLFTDDFTTDFSLPFTISANKELIRKLGLPDFQNITNVNVSLPCRLFRFDRHYPAMLHIGQIKGSKIECDISYGDHEMPVLNINLRDLPWPTIITPDLLLYAKDKITKSWPDTPFNFPMIYRPDIGGSSPYESFDGYVNNYQGFGFLQNYIQPGDPSAPDEEDKKDKYINRNVMAPCPYLLEILRFGFAQAGKRIVGELTQDEVLKQVVYIPENFLERFETSDFQEFSFNSPTEVINTGSNFINVYERTLLPEDVGSYKVKFDLNIPPSFAGFFKLQIIQRSAISQIDTVVSSYQSQNTRVNLKDDLSIDIRSGQELDKIIVKLELSHNNEDITDYNEFEFSNEEGKLNIFPKRFTASAFMPDMTFGEYLNLLKNWLNLDIKIEENYVQIDFVKNNFSQKKQRDHRHLEIPEPQYKINSGRFFKLKYADASKVYYNKNGQVFSDLSDESNDSSVIDIDVQPLIIESTASATTGVYPEEASKIDFAVYTGPIEGKPWLNREETQKLSIQNVFLNYWEDWLHFRVNSKTYKESFTCNRYEVINVKEISYKYNQLLLLKKVDKKYTSNNVMQVDVEGETL